MKREDDSKNGIINDILGRLAVEKKKAVTIACLFLVMVFMWVRAFIGKSPADAQAVSSSAGITDKQQNPEANVEFIELPHVKGRNDILTRDFFADNRRKTDMQDNFDSSGSTDAHISWIIKNLKLEAIGLGKKPQAFINGRVFSVGDELVLKDGDDSYVCEVIGIEQERVLIKYGQKKVELKFTEEIDVTY